MEWTEKSTEDGLFEMSLEELMEVPVVVSASRMPQKTSQAPAAISVITAEDIRRSGLTSIPEILQFVCGMDVLQVKRRWYAIGVRGLHDIISDRVQLLVDGRSADSVAFGGPEFHSLPIFVEDIDRIEIVRGPSGATWGANAFTGVINIITKKPDQNLRPLVATRLTDLGDSYTQLRWAQSKQNWGLRVSAGYEHMEDSDDAVDGTASYTSFSPTLNSLMGFGNFRTRDFRRNWRFDTEGFIDTSEATRLWVGTGYSHLITGDNEQLGYFPQKNARNEMLRSFVKVEHKFENGNTGQLQWYGNFWNANWPQYARYRTSQNNIEGILNLAARDNHTISVGANFRWTRINTHQDTDQQYTYPGEPFDEYLAGAFIIDRWQASERLTIETQVRGEWYSRTHTDWAGRLAGLYRLDDQGDHILRIGTGKAFRTPLIGLRKALGHTLSVGSGRYAINVDLPMDDLKNEETWSIETGYIGKLAKGVTLTTNGYYQWFDGLIGYRQSSDVFGLTHYWPDNLEDADAWGAEVELTITREGKSFSAWYALNNFSTDNGNRSIRSLRPAKHKVGLTARLAMAEGWILNVNYRFTNTTPDNPSTARENRVASSHRLDLTISRKFNNNRGEVIFGVNDLLEKTHDPIQANNALTGHEVPGRTFFVELLLKF